MLSLNGRVCLFLFRLQTTEAAVSGSAIGTISLVVHEIFI